MNPIQTVGMVESGDSASLSSQQQAFNQLILNIELLRKKLLAWQQMIPLYQQKYHTEFAPLLAQFDQRQMQLVHQFNHAYDDRCFTNSDKKKLSRIICQIAAGLIADPPDPEIQQIISMHAATGVQQPTDDPEPIVHQALKAGDDTLEPWEAAALEREQQKQQRQAQRTSAKARAAEAQQQTQEQDVSQSLRAVYRKLASALHPDREPEQAEQQRKTELMQRVNIAYGKKDLLQLLELQLETEQIDQHSLRAISAERLRHYHQILSEQQSELEQEIREIERSFGLPATTRARDQHRPDAILRSLQRQTQQLAGDISTLNHQLQLFQQPAQIHRWLQTIL